MALVSRASPTPSWLRLKPLTYRQRGRIAAYLFLLPSALGLIVFMFYPIF